MKAWLWVMLAAVALALLWQGFRLLIVFLTRD